MILTDTDMARVCAEMMTLGWAKGTAGSANMSVDSAPNDPERTNMSSLKQHRIAQHVNIFRTERRGGWGGVGGGWGGGRGERRSAGGEVR